MDSCTQSAGVLETFRNWILVTQILSNFGADLPRFVKGEAVVHDTFGSGTVGEVVGFGRDLKVTVHFDSVGTKRLLVRYAGLRRDFD